MLMHVNSGCTVDFQGRGNNRCCGRDSYLEEAGLPLFIYLSKSVQKSISLLTLSSIVSVEQFPSSYSKDFICTSQTTLSFVLRLCLISPARVEESLRARFESNFPLSCMYQMMGKLIDFLWGNITWYIFTRQ